MDIVIGSGPAGVACTKARLERGRRVTIIDAGLCLEPDRSQLISEMSRSAPSEWKAEHLIRLKAGTVANTKGLLQKLVYGSDFPYRETEHHIPADYDGVALRPSLARGGFSNVWGAALLPYIQRDIPGWPIQVSDLAEHYTAALKLMGISARRDPLERLFPLYAEHTAALELSEQSRELLKTLERNQENLARAGISFGQARLGVKAPSLDQPKGCVYCGLCMYGCPYGYIYNSGDTIRGWQSNPNFSYQAGFIVTSVRESGRGVFIAGYDRASGKRLETQADRVFLAAGIIPSTQILMRSMSLYDQTVAMKDSQYFLLPLALLKNAGDVRRQALHTLSQLFIEIFDPKISPYTIHLQVYSYNDLLGQALTNAMGSLAKSLDWMRRALENRLLVVQGYLHSDHSAQILATLRKGEPTERDRLQLKAEPNSQTRRIIRQVIRKLLRHTPNLRAIPWFPMLQISKPGRGFHGGGTFPMSTQPGPLQTDILGRPQGWRRLHVVDATVLNSIPATTITLSAMANAHRIGSNADAD